MVRRLAAYAAGSAAGAAVGSSALASVVFTDLGQAGVTVEFGAFDVDLNHDQQPEYRLGHDSVFFFSSTYSCFSYTNTGSVKTCRSGQRIFTSTTVQRALFGTAGNGLGNRIAMKRAGRIRLDAGELIDAASMASLPTSVVLASSENGELQAQSFAGQRGFLGLLFDIPGGGTHAGWADLEVDTDVLRATIYGFAYETEPGVPIRAGDTGMSVPGDTNADGVVDLEDLNNVRNNFGATGIGIAGDTNADLVVDLIDLNKVRNNFGTSNPVPEPPSLVLLAAGAAGLAAWRSWRQRRRKQS
jgi:hypothetical protein